jgi:glycosyltransferase involved in cell wall biosynthesis
MSQAEQPDAEEPAQIQRTTPTSDATAADSLQDAFGNDRFVLCGPAASIDPTISVVIPTLNEESAIEQVLRTVHGSLRELGVAAEIIVVDSSTDRTPDIARQHGAIVVEPERSGYGAAYQAGFERARGELLIMGDADTTYDFGELPRFLQELLETDADMVLGSRLAGEIKPGAMPPLHQYVGNPMLTSVLNGLFGAAFSDTHSGFRLITREALEQMRLETTGMEFASEMLIQATRQELDVAEVPITYHRREGEATLESFSDGWRHLRFMLDRWSETHRPAGRLLSLFA